MSNPEITVDINISDKDIERLENAKYLLKEIVQTLQQIKEIDNNFSLSNVIEADKDTILIFNTNGLLKQEDLDRLELMLTNKLQHKCIVLQSNITLSTAMQEKECTSGIDSETTTYYDTDGNIVKEESTYECKRVKKISRKL